VALNVVANRSEALSAKKLIAERKSRLDREGILVLGWIVMVDHRIYQADDSDGRVPAIVIYSPVDGAEGNLEDRSEKLVDFKPAEGSTFSERVVAHAMNTGILDRDPVKLPDAITAGVEGYMLGIDIKRKLLPKRMVTQPWLFLKVIVGEHGYGEMSETPDADD